MGWVVAFAFGLLAWPLWADAQQTSRIPQLAILSDEKPSVGAKHLEPFVQGLLDQGWVEGQNITIERRYAEHRYEALPDLAAELVRLQPDVILAIGTGAARAAKGATQTIPIVMARIGDPVGYGLVTSLSRPGGNVTGLSILTADLAGKRLELLTSAVPEVTRVGVLWDPSFPAARPVFKEIEAAARTLNLEIIPAEVRSPDDFEPAFQAMREKQARALIVAVGIVGEQNKEVADLAIKARLPAMFGARGEVEMGGLMSYSPSFPDMYRRAAAYVDKILKGAKPADIPVEQPTKFELVINLKTAKALSLTIPYTLLARADEVIE
jgi:putative ABC transport system substrate-binding protein